MKLKGKPFKSYSFCIFQVILINFMLKLNLTEDYSENVEQITQLFSA